MAITVALGTYAFRAKKGPRVDGVTPVRAPLVQTLVTSGRVVQRRQSQLGAQVQSTVVEVPVDEGDEVEADALLVRLADDEARAALQEAEASVAEAEARLQRVQGVGRRMAAQSLRQARIDADQAQAELTRQESLFSRGAISEASLERARRERDGTRSRRIAASIEVAASAPQGSDVQAAAATLARAQARLRAAEVGLSRTQLRAPSAGVVLIRHVETGEVVRPGEVLMTFAGEGPLEVRVQPDESNLRRLEVGQRALVSAEAFPDRAVNAQVARIAPSVDPTRGTIEVEISLDDQADLRPDMTVSVEIEVGRTEEALVVPIGLIRDLGSDRPWVLVAHEGTARRREVTLGLEGDDRVEVTEGLDEQAVLIAPTVPIDEDDPVRIRSAEPAS